MRGSALYVFVAALAAFATPLLGGRVAVAIWGVGAVVLMIVVARSDRKAVTAILVGVGVGLVAAFIAFVVMVNIWERLGIPH
jgi:hypothetical protein